MSIKADYFVSAIRYDNKGKSSKIVYLKVHKNENDSIGEGLTWSREEVINAIIDGKTFFTITKIKWGEWNFGKKIIAVNYNDQYYLVEETQKIEDSLSNLRLL